MKTNDVKKGTRVMLSFSASMGETPRWQGTMMDNMRGNTRVVDVEGWEHEMGSVYAYDIEFAQVDGKWVKLEHTEKQLELKKLVNAMW